MSGRHQGPPGAGFPRAVRGLAPGLHPFLALLPGAERSPALDLVGSPRFPGTGVVAAAQVQLVVRPGYCWVDETVPCIVLTQEHYASASDLDLYLDLMHEATHIRQVWEGRDVWDERFPYHRRPTEIEGYAVAVAECLRLGLDDAGIREHLANPWMSADQVDELFAAVRTFLAHTGPA